MADEKAPDMDDQGMSGPDKDDDGDGDGAESQTKTESGDDDTGPDDNTTGGKERD